MVWRMPLLWHMVLSLSLPGLSLAQAPSEACKERCTLAMMECLGPCAHAHSKNSEANLECIRSCRQKYQPCFKACE
jgi:hypothetical protein